MSKTVSFRRHDAARPPEGEAWIWHTSSLLRSPAWRGMSLNLRRLLEFLEIEHLQHGGSENGSLTAPYNDLARFGIGRRLIRSTIEEGERRGLIAVQHGLCMSDGKHTPSRFRLTYQPTRTSLAGGVAEWRAPTDEWRRVTAPALSQKTDRKCTKVNPDGCTKVNSAPKRNVSKTAKNRVHESAPEPSARR